MLDSLAQLGMVGLMMVCMVWFGADYFLVLDFLFSMVPAVLLSDLEILYLFTELSEFPLAISTSQYLKKSRRLSWTKAEAQYLSIKLK